MCQCKGKHIFCVFEQNLLVGNKSLSVVGRSIIQKLGAVFTKGLSQVLGLSWLYFYTKVKPKTWLRPFVNTAPGLLHY